MQAAGSHRANVKSSLRRLRPKVLSSSDQTCVALKHPSKSFKHTVEISKHCIHNDIILVVDKVRLKRSKLTRLQSLIIAAG